MSDSVCRKCAHCIVCAAAEPHEEIGACNQYLSADLVREREESRLIELPCRIGDDMWCIRDFKGVKHPVKGKVSDMFFTSEMKLMIVVKYVGRGEYGKTVFPTNEEAEAEIERRKHEHH